MAWLPHGEKNSKICLFVLTQLTNVTDGQTDRRTDTACWHIPRLCIASRGKNHRSLIQICITPSLETTSWFIPSASPVMSRLTSSFTYQLISIIITTLIIHHSFTLSLQAQNLPFQQILPTVDFFYLPDCLHDNGTGTDLSCSSFYF